MKPSASLRRFLCIASSSLLFISYAHAADVTWDITPGTIGAGDNLITGGLGTWDITNGNWTIDGGVNNIAWVNGNNDTAIFGGTAGTVTLGTGITVGGLTFDTAGYIVTGNTTTFGTAGNITANADATISSILAGAAITKAGTGTLVLSGNNTYTNTTISAGTLQIGAGGTTGTLGSGTVLNNSALSFNRSDQITVANVISGSGTVTHNGVGNLEITGNNSYSGGTVINSGLLLLRADLGADLGTGTVTVGSSGGANLLIWAPGAVTLSNNFVLNGATGVADRAALNHDGGAGLVTLTGTVTLNATSDIGVGGGSFNNMIISGVVSGAAGAGLIVDEKNSGGANFTLTLSGANTYTGPTTLTGGTLKAGVASVANVSGAFGNNSAVTLSNSAGVVLDIAGFATQIGSLTGGGALGGNVILGTAGNARTLTVGGDNTSPAAYAGVISQAGGLTKIGTGTQILSGTNTYTGGTNVSAGTLTFAGSSSGTLGAITVSGGGTTELKIQAGSYTQGAGGFFVGSGNGAGIVSQTGGAIAWNNNGLQLLIGNGGFAGTYNLSGGSLTTLTGLNSRGVMLGVNTGSNGTFNLSGTGTLTVAGTSRLMIGRSDAIQTNTTNLFSQTGGTATISDMTMGGPNAAAGGTGNTATLTLTGGTFTATAFSLLSAANNDVSTINIGGTAVVTLPAFPTTRGTGTTTTINFDGGTLKNSVASATYMNAQAATTAFIKVGGAQFDTTNGNITITQNLLTHGSSLNGGLIKIGTNTLTLSGTNTYTGATAVNVGTLQAGAAAGGQAFGNGSAVTLANVSGATLSLNGFNQTIGSLAGGGVTGGNVTLGANATLTTGGNNTSTSYEGVISGTGTSGLTKTGSGTQTLTGINTYTGATNITAGKLTINSTGTINTTSGISIGAGEFNYNSSTALSQSVSFSGTGGTLSGSSTITPAVNVTTGNILAIGNSNEGVMNFGSNLEIGGTYLFEINNTTNTADLGDVAGNLTLGGILDLVQLGAYAIGDKFTLLSYDGTLTGLFKDFGGVTSISDDTNFDDGGGTWTLNYNDATAGLNGGVSASNTYVTITAIPEPSAALLVGLGLLCLLRRRRN